jgi:molybdopterin synthase sulfur carrier subunit
MTKTIQLRLFASLAERMPENAAQFPIADRATVAQLIEALPITATEARLVFIDGVKATPDTPLLGGERVGIFPPVGGG